LNPGDSIDIEYVNALPVSKEPPNMTNLHFHGMTVSPNAPADDVLTMMAMPGQRLHYRVAVPRNQEPGLYWYHTHAHGESNWQVESGMSGALVVDGIETHDPAVLGMRERLLVLRDPQNDPDYHTLNAMRRMRAEKRNLPCGPEDGRHVTVNGITNASIAIRPGEQQFFRVVNASADRYFDLRVDGEQIGLVAQDGYAVNTYPGQPSVIDLAHVLVPPAGRAEFIVRGLPHPTSLRSACIDTGPDGDPNPDVTLASLVVDHSAQSNAVDVVRAATGAPISNPYLSTALPPPAAKRNIVFSEDPETNRFYINGRMFSANAPPMVVSRAGTVEEWTIENSTFELHAFHIHQTHFLVESINGAPVRRRQWLDTVNIPYARQTSRTFHPGKVVVLVNFLNPVIKGEFVFHCHLLEHEDGGMMAKILVR